MGQTHKDSSLTGCGDTRPARFFVAAHETFKEAERVAGGSVDCFYTIAGYTVRLRFAGSSLVPFVTPALEHLGADPCPAPALTICLWDSVSTGTRMPAPPWSSKDYISRGEIHGYNNERIKTVFHQDSGILNMLDTSMNTALFWIRDAGSVPYYETGAPLRTILHWFMSEHGRQLVHAAAIGTSGSGVLLAGKGGSGKSTTALACLSSGLFYVGDDYVILGRQSAPFVYSLYNSGKLDADHIGRLPHLLPAISNSERLDTEKALIFLRKHFSDKVRTGLPLNAILLPRITGLPETRLKKASPAASLTALAPSTMFQLPGAGPEVFRYLSDFVQQVPTYILELGTELAQIPEVVGGLTMRGFDNDG